MCKTGIVFFRYNSCRKQVEISFLLLHISDMSVLTSEYEYNQLVTELRMVFHTEF